MRISRRLGNRAGTLALATLLAGCIGGPTSDGQMFPDPIPQAVTVTAGEDTITVAAPPGFCVDRRTIDENPRGVFMFLSDCQRVESTGQMARVPISAILTASISPTPLVGSAQKGLKPALADLKAFLASPVGLFSMGKSNVDGAVRIVDSKQTDVALYLLIEDTAFQDEAGASNRFWRAFTEINGHLVALSVTGYAHNDPDEKRALQVIRAFMEAMRNANVPPTAAAATATDGS